MEHNSTSDNNTEEQQNQSEEADTSNRPSLSQVKKSWGFRRTTIARREFLEEVGDLAHSPPLLRRGKSRRISQTPQNSSETHAAPKETAATRSVIDDLEWSAPSSPVSDESKPASETFTGGAFDPSLWQDIGSAFHTAFSLLGGNEGLSLEVPNSVAPVSVEAADSIEPSPHRVIDETEIPKNTETTDDMENSQPVAPDIVSGEEIDDDVVLISSREDDSDEMTLLQIKKQIASQSRQVDTKARGVKGGRGKAKRKGRGRGRKKGKGRGRGRGRAVGLHLGVADDEEDDEEVMIVTPAEQQLREEESTSEPQCPIEIETSPAHSVTSLSPAHQSSSDCICIESDLDPTTDATPGQYEDAPEKQDEQERKDRTHEGKQQGQLDLKGYDSEALCCSCRQKCNNRFMICCNRCQGWFHGSCVGIDVTEGTKMEKRKQEYVCPPCTRRKQDPLLPEPQPEPGLSFPVCLTQSPSCEEVGGRDQQQTLKESEILLEEKEEKEAPESRFEPEPKAEMKTDGSFPLCIGPGCSKKALPDSVYCGTDCILQHAAFTMKTLTVSKVPKSKGRAQKKDASARPTAKVLRSSRMSKRLAGKAEEEEEKVEVKEDVGGQMEAATSSVCDPTLKEVQTTSPPSSQFCSASKEDSKQVEADAEDVTPSEDVTPEDSSTHAPTSQPAVETATSQSLSPETEPLSSRVSNQESADSKSHVPPTPETTSLPSATNTLAPRHHETGALMVTKTTYVIPKKQSVPQTLSSQVPASASFQKPPPTQTLLNETRNLLVPPAPSAPSSRPSQPPNNQVRQSIQRSLTSILYKRVCDCEDLEMTESDAAKLVASIEMEMFDIFRNTDSKYMNKYRTIMFNLKDPRNKGLLYSFIRGDISPFRLARMSQKDMQAIKASEPSSKETPEVKVSAVKTPGLLSKPEAVKVDLPPLNLTRPGRNTEQKKSLPAPPPKTKTNQKGHSSALPDVLTCMLKDTTSEHKTHLFDLKCKICTGQITGNEEEEPAKKKPKVSETRDKHEPTWKKSSGADSPLQAPPDSPDIDSPTSSLIDPSSRLIIDSPVLTIVESPASPITDSPASPIQESPASPVMDSPASPSPSIPKAASAQRTYAPVVIPAVSTATFTRRDPRTAANRSSGPSSGSSGPTNKVAYAPLNETRSALPSASASSQPQIKTVPKSILMKPSSSVESRLYGTSSRAVISNSSTEDETTQFLAKQEIVWKGFLNMLTVAKFVTKGYLVSGSAENLKTDLPDTIQIGGRIMPETVWDYVAKLKTSVTKELCVIRFHPATEEEEVAYVSLFSYFSSRGRFGVVANGSRLIKDLYLVPLSAKESIPSILQPLEGPGLETKRPNLLLGLAIIQKLKRPGSFPQEVDEKRPKVNLSKDPMWIPKPPVLYGSDNLEIFQPYDPETPANTSPPDSPSCPGSPSESSCSGSTIIPSVLTSVTVKPPVSSSATAVTSRATSNRIPDQNPTASGEKTPLQTILNSLFSNKKTVSLIPTDGTSAKTTGSVNTPACSQVSGAMVDPIVQQYGQKLKVKEVQEEENDLDRPYDPEEEYPVIGYKKVDSQSIEKNEAGELATSCSVDDDVAYDPEDETIFADIQGSTDTKPHIQTQISDSSGGPTPFSTQAVTPPSASTSTHTSTEVIQNLPMGTVVVSAATLTEQQRMLEELNKQIEEQKRQLKEQEEALRQQREAVGMFMAHFSVSDSLMSPPQKSLPLSQLSSLQGDVAQTESKTSQLTDKSSSPAETLDTSNLSSQSVKVDDTTTISNLNNDTNNVEENEEAQKNLKESDRYSSAGEIEDSDVAYDPEDESLFNEIFEDVFQGCSKNTDSSLSRTGRSASHRGASQSPYHSKKRRQSPKRRSRREKDRHRSPSKRSHRHSPSHSQRRRGRDRHRKSERDRSRHRAKDNLVQQGRHRRDHTGRRHSHGRRGSPSSLRQKDSESLSPKHCRRSSPNVLGKSSMVTNKNDCDENNLACNLVESLDENSSAYSCEPLQNMKLEISEPSSEDQQKAPVTDHENKAKDNNTQVDKYAPQASLIESKIDSAIPLREIDPPIRDSPQSPDPEPQFAKPSSIEKNDYVKIEKIRDPLSIACSLDEGDTKCLPVGGQTTLAHITWPSLGDSGPDIRNLDFIALDLQGSDSKTQSRIKVEKNIKDEDEQSQDFSSLQKDLLCLKTEEHSSQPENPNSQPGVTTTGESGGPQIQKEQKTSEIGKDSTQNNTGQSLDSGGMSAAMTDAFVRDLSTNQWQLRQNNCQGLNRGPLPRHGREANMGIEGFGRGRSLDSNKCTGLDGTVPRGDTLDRQGPQCGVEVQMKRPGSNRNFENRREMSVHTLDVIPSESMHELKRPDYTESRYMGHGQYMGGPHARADRDDTSTRNSRAEIVERDPNKRDGDLQGSNKQGQQQVRSEQIGQEEITIPSITNQNWGGPGSGLVGPNDRSQPRQNTGLGAHSREPDWHVQGSKVQDEWKGPEWRESGPVRVGPHIQDQWRVYQADRRGPNTEDMRRGRKGSEGPDFMASEPERRGIDIDVPVQGRRRPEGPDFTNQGPKRMIDALMHDRRGSGVPDFRRSESERRTPINDNQGLGMREPRGPDLVGPGFERRGPTVECPGLNRRPPTGPNFRKPWLENRGTDMDPSVTDRKGLQHPNFNEPRHEGRGLFRKDSRPAARETGDSNFIVPGPYRRGNGGPEYMGRETDSRDLSVEGPKSGTGGQDFRGPGHCRRGMSLGGLGADEGNLGGPDFRGPGYDKKVPPMGELEPDWKGPGSRDFRGPGPDFVGTPLRGLGLERGRSGGPDFVGPGTDRRVPVMAGLRPDRIGPGGPDFREPEPTRRGPVTDLGAERDESDGSELSWPVHERCYTTKSQGGPDFHGQELKSREGAMVGPGPNNRRQSSPDSQSCNWRDSSVQSQGPNRRGPGDQNTCALGPRSHTRGHDGTHLCGSEPESEHQYMNDPGTKRRGPTFRALRPEGQDSVIEVSGPNRKGPGGPNIGPCSFQHSGPNMEGTALEIRDLEGHNFRGPERGQTEIDGIGRGRGFPERPPFRFSMSDRRPSEINGQESDTRGPHLRVRPDTTAIDGPISDRGLRGPDFRGSSCEGRGPGFRGPGTDRYQGGTRYREPGAERRFPDMEGPETNWRRSGDFKQGNRQKGLNKRGQRPRKNQWEGSDFGGPEPQTQGSLDPEGLGEDRTGQNLRGSGPIRRHNRGPGPDMSILDKEDRWKRADFRSSTPDRRGAHTDEQWFDERGPKIEGPKPFFEGPAEHFQEHSRQAAHLDWRESENKGPKAIQERPNMRGRGPGDDWCGSNFKGPEPFRDDPDMECPGPSGRRLGNKWREPNREVGGPGRLGPGPFFRGVRDPENVGQCRDTRGLGIRGPDSDIKTGIDNEWRGPDMRRRGPIKTDDQSVNHGPGRWDTITDCPELDSSEPAPPYFNSPHQVVRFQGPSGPHSAPVSGPQGPTQNSGENICHGFDKHQNQQTLKPQRHRGALLPTPTGVIRFPNRTVNNPDFFSRNRKQIGHS